MGDRDLLLILSKILSELVQGSSQDGEMVIRSDWRNHDLQPLTSQNMATDGVVQYSGQVETCHRKYCNTTLSESQNTTIEPDHMIN